MHKIRDWIYIGKYSQTLSLPLLKQYEITAMLQLADRVPQPKIDSLFLNVTDGEPISHDLIKRGVAFVREQRAADKTILVACGAGISRSSTYVIATLMEEENLSLFDAYTDVYRRYRDAEPHLELMVSLADYHGMDMDLMDMWEKMNEIQLAIKAE